MNRREALAALTAMPAVTRIAKADVQPKDVIVFELDDEPSQDAEEQMRATARRIWPNNRIMLLWGAKLKVVQAGA